MAYGLFELCRQDWCRTSPLLGTTLTSVRFIRFEWADPEGWTIGVTGARGRTIVGFAMASCVWIVQVLGARVIVHELLLQFCSRGLLNAMFYGMVLPCFTRLDSRAEFCFVLGWVGNCLGFLGALGFGMGGKLFGLPGCLRLGHDVWSVSVRASGGLRVRFGNVGA